MTNDDEAIGLLLAGGIGYLLGDSQYKGWKPVIDQYNRRLQQITFAQVPLPWGFFTKSANMRVIYRQSVLSYLFGLPDACLPTLIRVLELALKSNYAEVEGKKPSREMCLANLIDWGESLLKDKLAVAHSFRLLRNLVHTDNLAQEQDSVEAIRHVSIIVENLYPGVFAMVNLNTRCPNCGFISLKLVSSNSGPLGTTMPIDCPGCKNQYNWTLMP